MRSPFALRVRIHATRCEERCRAGCRELLFGLFDSSATPQRSRTCESYFADRTDELRRNDPISVVYGANSSGSLSIDGVTLASLPGTVTKLGDFNVFDVPAVTISASQRRSHVSSDGVHFTLLDDVGSGNIGVRATVRLP